VELVTLALELAGGSQGRDTRPPATDAFVERLPDRVDLIHVGDHLGLELELLDQAGQLLDLLGRGLRIGLDQAAQCGEPGLELLLAGRHSADVVRVVLGLVVLGVARVVERALD
jgi:hypothetical protein